MKLITASAILALIQKVHAQSYFDAQSPFDIEKAALVATEESNLDLNPPFWTIDSGASLNLLGRMREDNIITNPTDDPVSGISILARILGYSIITDDTILIKPTSCATDSFGIGGNFTDSVCDTRAQLDIICASETGCDAARIPNVVSASAADMLQQWVTVDDEAESGDSLIRKQRLMRVAVCINRVLEHYDDPTQFPNYSTVTINDCVTLSTNIPDESDLSKRVEAYHGAMLYSPGFAQANNPLWTNTATATSKDIDPNACFVLGDGYLDLAERALNAFEDVPTQTNNPSKTTPTQTQGAGHREQAYAITTVVDTIVHQYTTDEEDGGGLNKGFFDPDDDLFYRDTLRGYFFQKYSADLFPTKPLKKVVMDGTFIVYRTKCAAPLGALLASKCGVDAADVHSYIDYYINNHIWSPFPSVKQCGVACAEATTRRECNVVGIHGDTCTWDGSTCSAVDATAKCITGYCKNWNKNLTWKAKRAVTSAASFVGTKKTPAECFSALGLF